MHCQRNILILALVLVSGGCSETVDNAIKLTVVRSAMPVADTFSAGGTQTCIINDSGQLYCWGDNSDGQLGLVDSAGSSLEDQSIPVRVGEDSDWQSISAGYFHTCAIKTDGSLYCWGQASSGEIGIANVTTDQLTPARVGTDTDWSQVAGGRFSHTCALKNNGQLWCWGNGGNDRLGLGTGDDNRPVPTQVGTDTDWRFLSAGIAHNCALKTNNQLWCWGIGTQGESGTPDFTNASVPTQVGTDTDWAELSLGDRHACAIKEGGQLYCWGQAGNGRLGIGMVDDATVVMGVNTPTQVGGDSDWTAVGGGLAYTCALKGAGQLWCWGSGRDGVLGIGDAGMSSRDTPMRVGELDDWRTISAGDFHACASNAAGDLYCWGNNRSGTVGDGTTTDRIEPTRVMDENLRQARAGLNIP